MSKEYRSEEYFEKFLHQLQNDYTYFYEEIEVDGKDIYVASFWKKIGSGREIPIINNTGELWVPQTSELHHPNIEGDRKDPSQEFFSYISLGYHFTVSQIPEPLEELPSELVDSLSWAEKELADFVLGLLLRGEEPLIHELGPIVQYVDEGTEWGVPEVYKFEMGDYKVGETSNE